MILSDNAIRLNHLIEPLEERGRQSGMSYGLGPAGYDVRVDMPVPPLDYRQVHIPGKGVGVLLEPGQGILLGVRGEFNIPAGVVGFVKDKSTWARRGLLNAQAVLEPGWQGYLSVRVTNLGDEELAIMDGDPIAQVVFLWLDSAPSAVYDGKYQNQGPGPQGPILEP